MTCFHTVFTVHPVLKLTLTPTPTITYPHPTLTLTLVLATPMSIFNRNGRSASSGVPDRQEGKQTCLVLPNETDAYFIFRE